MADDFLIKLVRRVALELMVGADEQEQKNIPARPKKRRTKKVKRNGNVIEVDFKKPRFDQGE